MRRMIPQKLIDELVARLEREEQTKEMLKHSTVFSEDDIACTLNVASDGETYLTITGHVELSSTDECTIELRYIPTEFLSNLQSAGLYLATNSLDGGESVAVTTNDQSGYITLTFSAGDERTVFSTITLSTTLKEV